MAYRMKNAQTLTKGHNANILSLKFITCLHTRLIGPGIWKAPDLNLGFVLK